MRREDLLKKFLGCHNINIIDKEGIKKHFELEDAVDDLVEFHKRVQGKRDYSMGIISEAGRIKLEQKISLMRMERFQKESGIYLKEVIEYAKECMKKVSEEDFKSLIDRSYKKSEITIGKVYQNICSDNIFLDVSDTSRVKFGMVEDDFIKFIRRVEKREKNLNYELMLDKFIDGENLSDVSRIYINSVMDYPSDIASYISFAYLRDFDDERVKEGLVNIESDFKIF